MRWSDDLWGTAAAHTVYATITVKRPILLGRATPPHRQNQLDAAFICFRPKVRNARLYECQLVCVKRRECCGGVLVCLSSLCNRGIKSRHYRVLGTGSSERFEFSL